MASSRSLSDAATGARSSISNDDDVELRLPPGTLRRRARSRQHIDSPAQGADQSKTLPKPTTIIPFSRDTNFIEREDAFERINQACAVPSSWTALVGLGGVGKSQLAIEFAYRTREKSPENWVFWVHSSNAARFEQSYRNIAATIKIAGFQNPDANIYQLVHEWLCDESNGKWIMILDNVDDADFLIAAPNPGDGKNSIRVPLVSFLPHSQNGSILITSRSRNAALSLVDQDEIIMLEPMNQSEAVALLERKLGQQGESEAVELAVALDFMPLAIAQAAAYISQRRPRYSVKQYLLDFQASDHTRTSLLDRGNEGGQLRRDWEAKNSIMTTWQISFDHIRRIQSTAADLLAIMSFYDRQGIPDYLLQKSTYQERHDDLNGADQDTDPAQANLQFEDDVKILRDYSFICISPDGATFEMHRLVQLAMLKWLRQSGQLEKWKQRYIRSLRAEFPIGWYENWAQCQVLFPHIKLAATLPPPEEKSALQDFASLLYEAAWYAYQRGDASEAIKMSKQVMEIRISLFGREHRETVNSMGMLGVAYALGRRWVEAESLFEQAVRWLKESYGLYHFSTLNCMTNLAATYSEQGKWDLAEEMEVEAIEASKELLGVSDLDTIFRMRGHAVTLRYQGKWDASEKLLKEALSRSKSRVNIDHPYTLTIMASLGATYECQGRWEAAEKLGVEVLEKRMKILGGSHPDTLLSMSSLASSYRSQGRWNLAENLDLEVFHSRSTSFGTGHPDTLVSMEDLTLTYKCQGRWEEAEELSLKAMDLRKQNGMANQPEMLATMSMLASIYWHQGDFDAAEELLDEVLEKQTERFGVNHPNTLESMSYLASTYRSQGKLLAAEKLGLETLERRAKCYGTSHPDTLLSIHDLGLTYRKQGDWKFAGEMLQEALDGQKEIIGAHHPDTLTSMASLSFLWREQGLRREALNLMRECVRLRRGFIGDNHPDFVSSSKTLAEWEAEKSEREASTSLEDGT